MCTDCQFTFRERQSEGRTDDVTKTYKEQSDRVQLSSEFFRARSNAARRVMDCSVTYADAGLLRSGAVHDDVFPTLLGLPHSHGTADVLVGNSVSCGIPVLFMVRMCSVKSAVERNADTTVLSILCPVKVNKIGE